MGYGYGPAPMGYGAPRSSGCGCGCLSGVISLVVGLALLAFLLPSACVSSFFGGHSSSSSSSSGNNGVVLNLNNQGSPGSTSARTREKLAATECVESSRWVDDQAEWLDNENTVIAGMRSFYEMSGVQPYLVIADNINGSKNYTEADVERYMRSLYDELFEDDGHLILLFCEPYENEYEPYLLVGEKAAQVVDTEGENLIYEAIDRWYTDGSLSDDEYFARIFIASANALMRGTSFSEFD